MSATTTGKLKEVQTPEGPRLIRLVIYEKGTDFKMDYYLKTHMPLVQEKWAEFGLKSWKVRQRHTQEHAPRPGKY